MTIDREAPVSLDLEQCRFWQYDRRDVVSLLTDLEFFSVVPRVPSPDGSDLGEASADREPEVDTDYTVVQSDEQLDSMIAAIEGNGQLHFRH